MNSAAMAVENGEKTCERKGGCGCTGGKAPGYLAALTLTAWGIQIPMLLFAVPKYAEFLREFGVKLPEVSRLVINLSDWMQGPVGNTIITGTMVYAAAVLLLSLVAFVLAKVGGGLGKTLVVMLAVLGGAIACGQAASVILPTMSARSAVQNGGTTAAP